jgi:hypothetical protein
VRIALISSPRSGNTFIRAAIAHCLGIAEIAIHDYREAPQRLPDDVLLQIHWRREPEFLAWLESHHFRVATIARHPLDVLLSAVRFASREPQVARWLGGNTILPVELGAAGSASPEFLRYCLSDGAAALLSVTPLWWHAPDTLRIRYEEVAVTPERAMSDAVMALGGDPSKIPGALEASRLERWRATPNQHGWRGRAGNWTELIATTDAIRIFWRHREVFASLGYPPPVTFRSRAAASRQWAAVA